MYMHVHIPRANDYTTVYMHVHIPRASDYTTVYVHVHIPRASDYTTVYVHVHIPRASDYTTVYMHVHIPRASDYTTVLCTCISEAHYSVTRNLIHYRNYIANHCIHSLVYNVLQCMYTHPGRAGGCDEF